MYGAPTAIMHITQLILNTKSIHSSSVEDLTSLLSPLAAVCPNIKQLQLTGPVERELLAMFGTSCEQLSSLVVSDTQSDALQQLHLIFQNLTHVQFLDDDVINCQTSLTPVSGSPFLPILSCTSLTHVDFGSRMLAPEVWQALPPALQELHCSLKHTGEPRFPILINLQRLTLHGFVRLEDIAAILHRAPQLTLLKLHSSESDFPDIGVACFSRPKSGVQDLVMLHNRILAGLEVESTCSGEPAFQGVMLWMPKDRAWRSDSVLEAWSTGSLPPFSAFTGVLLMDMHYEQLALLLLEFPRVFPNLQRLVIYTEQSWSDAGLMRIGACSSLQHLKLILKNGATITLAQLAMLVPRLPNLKVLCLAQSLECPLSTGEYLQSMLQNLGYSMRVIVTAWSYD